jgi:hypothetical protein
MPIPRRRPRSSVARSARRIERCAVDSPDWCPVGGSAGPVSALPNVSSTVSSLGPDRRSGSDSPRLGRGCARSRWLRPVRVLHRRDLCHRKNGGLGVGKTKRGKGTKIMAVADRTGLPVAIHVASASPHEVTLVEATLAQRFTRALQTRLIRVSLVTGHTTPIPSTRGSGRKVLS